MESQSLQESPKKSSSIVIPEDFESQKEMVRRMNVFLQKICFFPLLCNNCYTSLKLAFKVQCKYYSVNSLFLFVVM